MRRNDPVVQVDVHEPVLPLRVVQRLRGGVGIPLVSALRESGGVMGAEVAESDTGVGCALMFDDDDRRAWLRVGAFIASADGLSDDEARALAASAWSPTFSAADLFELLRAAAAKEAIDAGDFERIARGDLSLRLACMLETLFAVASDGFSAAEWGRAIGVVGRVFGSEKVDAFVKLYVAESNARSARSEFFSD